MTRFVQTRVRLLNDRQLHLLRAVDVFDELIHFLRMFLTQCGVDILLMEKFRWNSRTWLCVACNATFLMSVIYTVAVHWKDWYAIMNALSIIGIGFQGIIKLYKALAHKSFFQEKYLNLRVVHERSSEHPRNNVAMVKCALIILYAFRFFFVSYAVAGMAFFVLPVYMMVVRQEKMMILPLELPFVDPATESGFTATTVYHSVLVVLAIMGILAADMGIMIFILHMLGIVDVFMNNLKELDELLVLSASEESVITDKVTEICKMHREIIRYEEDLDEFYHQTVFVQVITSVTCLSLTLFVIYMTNDWTRIMFIFATFAQLLEFCLLGTVLTLKNDQIILAIYDTNWYLLSKSDQKNIAIMLHRSQNAVEMTIGGISLLNMETFVEIIKTIYSYFAMMVSFLE
ncbi:putative odorant receptor 83c [Topomyia yanbarensis]|uniref:putative odorant receptor 83c n=1 Tax=Topomyia yanbarensis TaxID=2498891 RepID=UPI00273CD9DE|nr:putative odorant receptor 83c [Topomyia yanbarensis]